jgi:hypothetical protein
MDDAGGMNPYEHLAFPWTGLLRLVVGERLGAIAGAQTNRLHAPLPNKHLSAELRVFGPKNLQLKADKICIIRLLCKLPPVEDSVMLPLLPESCL